jgi:peptidoglycan/xylan/chitin deacetylase (PgdA/CDA1 family)
MSFDSGRRGFRVVILTAAPLSPVDRVLVGRLAGDPLLSVAGIVVAERRDRRSSWGWVGGARPPHDELERALGVRVLSVADLDDAATAEIVRSLRPDLGVIVGSGILRSGVVSIPEHGTLSIHKGRAGQGTGGPVGYWEMERDELSLDLTIAEAVPGGGAGRVLGAVSIPLEECETLESVAIKADIQAAMLCHDVITRLARGDRAGESREAATDARDPQPSRLAIARLRTRRRWWSASRMPMLRAGPSAGTRLRLLLQYGMLWPWLTYLRHRLVRRGRAPVCVLYYHSVANHPLNDLCLPLEIFVAQVQFLRRFYDVVSIDEAAARLRSGQTDRIAVSISFDDGYRANEWAIRYLEYLGIPASFFVSIGHVRDGRLFDHDLRAGFREAFPMRERDVRGLASAGFAVGSHGLYHEDLGQLAGAAAERVLCESRELIAQVCGRPPKHFSFPFGQRAQNITRENFELALKHYSYIHSAYGGYNFPGEDVRHFLRIPAPPSVFELAMIMDGYTGFRQCLLGNAWGLKTHRLSPY